MEVPELISLFWGEKEILRGAYKQKEYGDIILPFVLLRRIDQVLDPSRTQVLQEYEKIKKLDPAFIDAKLNKIAGKPFHNKTKHTMNSLLTDPINIQKNLLAYIKGFSQNIQEIFEHFKLEGWIKDLHKKKRLYKTVKHFEKADISPKKVDSIKMGTIYEELIRISQEAGNEEAGEHFTPREVIRLLSKLILIFDKDKLNQKGIIRSIYDPAVGTGGMLSVATEEIKKINPDIDVQGYGQELNPQSFAICKSDMLIKDLNSENIKYDEVSGSLGKNDGFLNDKFHYMISNPPYGVDWGAYENEIKDEHGKGSSGKYGAGLPRKSDGSLLFVMQMLSKMKSISEDGSRIGIVLNGSPLYTGEPSQKSKNENSIRRWIIENDYLEAIIALPSELFYNTPIGTYIWLLTNKKEKRRLGKIQLIDCSGEKFFTKLKKAIGEKKNEIADAQINDIYNIYTKFEKGEFSKIFKNSDFGYQRINVNYPLKQIFEISEEKFKKLPEIKLKNQPTRDEIIKILRKLEPKKFVDYNNAISQTKNLFSKNGITLNQKTLKIIQKTFLEKNQNGIPELDSLGKTIPDPDFKSYEDFPLNADIKKIEEIFRKDMLWEENKPEAYLDHSSNQIGFDISFTLNFYSFTPPRSVDIIDKEILKLQEEKKQSLLNSNIFSNSLSTNKSDKEKNNKKWYGTCPPDWKPTRNKFIFEITKKNNFG